MPSRRSTTRWTLYRFSTERIFRGIVWGTSHLPLGLLRFITRVIFLSYWPFVGRVRAALYANAAIIHPELPARELRRLARLCLSSYLRGAAEFWHYSAHYDPRAIREPERDMDFLKEGGYILLSSHVGNWELGALNLVHSGVSFVVVSQPEEDPYVEQQRQKARARFGIRTLLIEEGEGILFKVRQHLEGGDNIILLADRAFAQDFVPVKFFGIKAAFLKTPFMLSRWLQRPIIPLFFIKEPSGKYRGCPGARLAPDAPERMAQAYARELEAILRRFPYQWYNFFDYARYCRSLLL